MNNAATTKLPPCATRPLTTKVCRWILTLGILKVCLLVSLGIPTATPPVDMRVEAALKNTSPSTKNVPTIRARVGVAHAAEPSPAPNLFQKPATSPKQNMSAPDPTPIHSMPNEATTPMPQINAPAPQIGTNQYVSPFSQNPSPASMQQANSPQGNVISSSTPAPQMPKYAPRDSAERKQHELNRREQELLALQQQMQTRLDELKRVEDNVQGMLNKANTTKDGNIQHLIDVYANMKPKQAALILADLDERISVKILAGLKPGQAGQILGYMQTEPAAKLSELLSKASF